MKKLALLATISIAAALAASSASAQLAAGCDYYGRNCDPYTHHGPRDPTGFPPVGQSGPNFGGGVNFTGYQNNSYGMSGNCSSSFTANGQNVSAHSRCKQDPTPAYVQGAAVLLNAGLGFYQTRTRHQQTMKSIDAQVFTHGASTQATVGMNADNNKTRIELARLQAEAQARQPQAHYQGGMLIQKRMCAGTMGPYVCTVPVIPMSEAYPIPAR